MRRGCRLNAEVFVPTRVIAPCRGKDPACTRGILSLMKPRRLLPGDTIGIIAPSWCGPSKAPHRVERGIRYLESQGYKAVMGPHAAGCRGYLSGTPEERADDIHRFLRDTEVKAVISAIGGNHSCHLLPLLDWDLFARNPKIIMGFSDMTVLNLAIYSRAGVVTFNGPALMTDLAEFPAPLDYTIEYMEKVICRTEPIGVVEPADMWTEEFLDWEQKIDLTRPRLMRESEGWTWLKGGLARGRLIGGCIESMEHLRGTPYWPDLSGAILFFETSEDAPDPEWVDAALQDYENMGALGQISGLLFGRPMRYSQDKRAELRSVLLERTKQYGFPIIADMDFGHTSPQVTLPIGCMAEIDVRERRFEIVESAVQE